MTPPETDDEGPDPFDGGGGPFQEDDLDDALASTRSAGSADSGDTDPQLTVEELRAIVSRHQSRMRDLPGIEELAYEWRSRQGATVLDRTESAYWLAVPAAVWAEYGRDLGLDETERRALRAVHARAVDRRIDGELPGDDAVATIVLDRRSGPNE